VTRFSSRALLALAVAVPSAQQIRFDDVVRNLRNPDPKQRAAAVRLLRDAKYPEAVAPMAPLVLDPLDDIQLEAIAAELGFFGYLYWRTGDPLAHFHAQERGWGRGVSVLPVVVAKGFWDGVHGGQLRYLVHVAFTLLWCGLWYHAWRRLKLPAEYLIYAALLLILPTSGGLIVSMGRFGMVAFPLF